MGMLLSFQQVKSRDWSGRYGRIPGDGPVFHVKRIDGQWWPAILWQREDEEAWCPALDVGEVRELTEAVNDAKLELGGWQEGGSFIINEHGQVIVPAPDGDGRRLIVGETSGRIFFFNSFDGSGYIDMADDETLSCGDPWPWPYIGCRYNLSNCHKIYHWHTNEDGGRKEDCPRAPEAVVEGLREIRRTGAVRFVVNYQGIVLTKQPPEGRWVPEERWDPIYVTRISKSRWFGKEA